MENKKSFLITFTNGNYYITTAYNFREALVSTLRYNGGAYELLQKSLGNGFKDTEIDEMLKLYNILSTSYDDAIQEIYILGEKIY